PTVTDTPSPTITDTPSPTITPTPGNLDVAKTPDVSSAHNISDTVTYTIHIINGTGGQVTITQIKDTFSFFIVAQCVSNRGGTCTLPAVQPGTITWTGSATLNNTQTMDLTI